MEAARSRRACRAIADFVASVPLTRSTTCASQGAVLIVSAAARSPPQWPSAGHCPRRRSTSTCASATARVTEFVFSEKRHSLLSFNTCPTCKGPARAGWITYS